MNCERIEPNSSGKIKSNTNNEVVQAKENSSAPNNGTNGDYGTQSHAIPVEQKQTVNTKDYKTYLLELKKLGQSLRSDHNQPNLGGKPSWFNEDLFENAKLVYSRHFMGINFAHLSGLLLLVRVDSIYGTLSVTGESDTVAKLFKRYFHTVMHVKKWYEGDIYEDLSEAHRSLLIVRGMHNKVSSKLNCECPIQKSVMEKANKSFLLNQSLQAKTGDETNQPLSSKNNNQQEESGNNSAIHISQYDIMITQFAFIGFIVTNANKMGLIEEFSRRDLDSLIHFWRVIGFNLGLSDRLNLCAYELSDVVGLCEAIVELEYKASMQKNRLHDSPGIMSVNIVRAIKFIPMLTVYGIMRHLYDILGQESNEIDPRRTSYSDLSYYLIKLVMTRLLAYRPLRAFNNALTRLSLYAVGKYENWYANRLETKYGQELKV